MPILRSCSRAARLVRLISQEPQRHFSQGPIYRTDGVYEELTKMRVTRPWIEAFKESQQGKAADAPPKQYPKPDLTPKTMRDSYVRIILPLLERPFLLDTYGNASGQIRIGALLMDLDALAGVVAYKHTGESVSTVTAAVDRISIQNPLKDICDLEYSGQVTFATGRSSMEVTLQVAKAPEPGKTVHPEDIFMTCSMTMVALDPNTKKPVSIAPLKLETQADRTLFARGEQNYKAKKALKSSHILTKPPNAEESASIHRMWLESLAYKDKANPATQPANTLSMAKTLIHSTSIAHPKARNRHQFMIFGGYLLMQTYDLAFTCAAAFSHSRVRFVNLDPSTFEEPVPVGSVLYISAQVTYTEKNESVGGTNIQVMVNTHVRNVEHAERKNTGTFFYTFHSEKDVSVLCESYADFMKFVSGRRRDRAAMLDLRSDSEGQSYALSGASGQVTE